MSQSRSEFSSVRNFQDIVTLSYVYKLSFCNTLIWKVLDVRSAVYAVYSGTSQSVDTWLFSRHSVLNLLSYWRRCRFWKWIDSCQLLPRTRERLKHWYYSWVTDWNLMRVSLVISYWNSKTEKASLCISVRARSTGFKAVFTVTHDRVFFFQGSNSRSC